MRPVDRSLGTTAIVRPACFMCGRTTYDPERGEGTWARAVAGGRQVLVCPPCQRERPEWVARVDRCERCGSPRLSAILGEVVCRSCGHVTGA